MGVFSFSSNFRQLARWTLSPSLHQRCCFLALVPVEMGVVSAGTINYLGSCLLLSLDLWRRLDHFNPFAHARSSKSPSLLNVFIMLVRIALPNHFKPNSFSCFLGTWFLLKVLGTVCCKRGWLCSSVDQFWMSSKCFSRSCFLKPNWVFLMCLLHNRHVALCVVVLHRHLPWQWHSFNCNLHLIWQLHGKFAQSKWNQFHFVFASDQLSISSWRFDERVCDICTSQPR